MTTKTPTPGTALTPREDRRQGRRTHHGDPRPITVEIREGQFWRYEGAEPVMVTLAPKPRVAVAPGDSLLVTAVKVHEGEAHSVVLRLHPRRVSRWQQALTVRARDLIAHWKACDGAAERARDVAALHRRIDDQESALERLRRTGHLPALPWEREPRAAHALATVQRSVQDLQRHQDALKSAAARIKEAHEALAPYHEERQIAIQCAHAHALEEVERTKAALDILHLYSGKSVEVEHWHPEDAAPADPHEPLHAFQRCRYIDEESLYHLLEGDDGADIRDLQTYMRALVSDPGTRERVVPHPRCVVALQPRRFPKHHDDITEQLLFGREDERTFVLIRNGERFTTVHWDMGTWTRLVPRRDTWKNLFRDRRGWHDEDREPRWIGIEDVRFVDTLRRAQEHMRQYLTAWVVLAGLHLREAVFAPLAAEHALGRPLNLMIPHEHDRLVRIVRDEEDALAKDVEPWEAFLARTNAKAHAGGRAVVHARRALRRSEQRDWYTKRELEQYEREPILSERPRNPGPQILTVRLRQHALIARCPAQRGRPRVIELRPGATWWMWLEDADPEALRDQLDHHRQDYLEIAPLAIPALSTLRESESEDRERALSLARWPPEVALEALRAYRATHEGRRPSDAALQRTARALTAATRHRARIAERLAPEPLAQLAINPKGELLAYSVAQGEHARAGDLAWARAHRVRIHPAGALGAVEPLDGPFTTLNAHRTLTRPLLPAHALAALDGRHRSVAWECARDMHRAVHAAGPALARWFEALEDPHTVRARIDEARRKVHASHRMVRSTGIVRWPVAVLARDSARSGHHAVALLCVQSEVYPLLFACLGETILAEIDAALERIYQNAQIHQNAIRRGPGRAGVGDAVLLQHSAEFALEPGEGALRVRSTEHIAPARFLCRRERLLQDRDGRLLLAPDENTYPKPRPGDTPKHTEWRIIDHPPDAAALPETRIAHAPRARQ